MSVFSSYFNEPFHNPFGSPFNGPGVGGGVFELVQFMVTDNGGEAFQTDDGASNPEDFQVRA